MAEFKNSFLLPTNTQAASEARAGVVKVGQALTMDENGKLNVDFNQVAAKTNTQLLEKATVRAKAGAASTDEVFRIEKNDGTELFKVTGNGDTTIAGVITVNGDGESFFKGDVRIGGDALVQGGLTVLGDATIKAILTQDKMTVTGDLHVNGNTFLGDDVAQDKTYIKGKTMVFGKNKKSEIESKVMAELKRLYPAQYGSLQNLKDADPVHVRAVKEALPEYQENIFAVYDGSAMFDENGQLTSGTPVFKIKPNGDTIIAGIIEVNGDGTSKFLGNVDIGGRLNVQDGISGGTEVDLGQDLTVQGKLVVKGITELGDDAAEDWVSIKGKTTIKHQYDSTWVQYFVKTAINAWRTRHQGIYKPEDLNAYRKGEDKFGESLRSDVASLIASKPIDGEFTQEIKDSLLDSYRNVFEVIDSTNKPVFEVKSNGDTVVAGVLSVNGDGASFFQGDVDINGSLFVLKDANIQGIFSGNSLRLTGNLLVDGNTTLGNDATSDTTTINGLTTIISPVTKSAGSASIEAFKVVDSANSPLFQVMENGDAVIAGIIKVNGTGESQFAGNVRIGGNLEVDGTTTTGGLIVKTGATVEGEMSSDNLTIKGNLIVKGNTTLGDNEGTDTITANADINMTNHRIVNLGDPIDGQDAATKAYVDSVATGLDVKASVRVATTEPIALSGLQTIDGVVLASGNRVLVKDQGNGSGNAVDNGIYVASETAWLRAEDADGIPVDGHEVTSGMFTFVEEGTKNRGTGWSLTTNNPIVIGTSPLQFSQFSGAGTYLAGTGLSLSGNTFNVKKASITDLGAVKIGTGIVITEDGTINITASGMGGVGSEEVTVTATADKIVRRDADASIKVNKISEIGKAATEGLGVTTSRKNVSNQVVNATQTVAQFTPVVQGNFLVYIYVTVNLSDNVTIEVSYNDVIGPQVQTIIDANNGATLAGSYSMVPLFINATTANPIKVNVTSGLTDNVKVSANISAM